MINSADMQWHMLLARVMASDIECYPRGFKCKEVLNYTGYVDMYYPVVSCKPRKLGYKFMAAEALWILSGDNRVSTIAPWSKEISKFSDDGETFFGAYGPKIRDQLDYVVNTLMNDFDSRQAVLTIWRENPPKTKDVPCTIAIQWLIRNRVLVCIDNMRSSDSWLGWPYDVFNFSIISHYICAHIWETFRVKVRPGHLYINCGSQHIYDTNFKGVHACLKDTDFRHRRIPTFESTDQIVDWLIENRKTGGLNPWLSS